MVWAIGNYLGRNRPLIARTFTKPRLAEMATQKIIFGTGTEHIVSLTVPYKYRRLNLCSATIPVRTYFPLSFGTVAEHLYIP